MTGSPLKLALALLIGLIIGYYLGRTLETNSQGVYIDYVIDYKTCVNDKASSVAQECGINTQIEYPELFVK